MKNSFFRLFLLVLICSGFYYVSDSFIPELEEKLERCASIYPQEKVYVHTDRQIYLAGEDVWYKVYLRDANTMLSSEISSVVYVELIDQSKRVVIKKNILIQAGSGNGDFELPLDLPIGDYTIRAYTNFMGNFDESFFFKTNIKIIGAQSEAKIKEDLNDALDVEFLFFPEGGDLVDGLSSRVGFKALDKKTGNGVSVSGRVVNKNGEVVAYLKTLKFGLGFFEITPDLSEEYVAEIEFESEVYNFSLPEILEKGYVMKVLNQTEDDIMIQLSTNKKEGIQDLYIVGQMRGSLFYAGNIQSEKQLGEIKISKDSLPDGVAQFTLFNALREPLCERLVFIESRKNSHSIQIIGGAPSYGVREKVSLKTELKDYYGKDVPCDLSLAVVNDEFQDIGDYSENIKSWILLNSDLRGKVEQAGFYFSNEKKSTKRLLDILMMTQGWRRFTWKQLSENDFPELNHLPEYGFNFKGHITKENTDTRQEAKVYLTVMGDDVQFLELDTDSLGNFLFENIHYFDSTAVVLQGRREFANQEKLKKKKKNANKLVGSKLLDIHLEREAYIDVEELAKPYGIHFSENQFAMYNDKYMQLVDEKSLYGDLSIELSSVTVTAKKLRKNMTAMEKLDSRAVVLNQRIILDSIDYLTPNGSVLQLLSMTPGLRIGGTPFQETVSASGGSPTLRRDSGGSSQNVMILVDDMIVDISVLHNLAPERIHFIDFYSLISIDGQLPAPAILVYTRSMTGVSSIKQNGIMHVNRIGYSKNREFYVPKYDIQNIKDTTFDSRTTLHWEPFVQANASNEIDFFTCDEVGDYVVVIQGMTEDGNPVDRKSVV